jgi:hypothetical protein
MPRRIEHKHAFGPRELHKLAHAFEGAWRDLAGEANNATSEQLEVSRVTLAQWVMTYAARGGIDLEDVEQLKQHVLFGIRCSAELGHDPASDGDFKSALKIVRARALHH